MVFEFFLCNVNSINTYIKDAEEYMISFFLYKGATPVAHYSESEYLTAIQ